MARQPPERSYPRPGPMPPNPMAMPWHVYERWKENPKYGEFHEIWFHTGFAAYGMAQAECLARWLAGQNPDYEYLVSK